MSASNVVFYDNGEVRIMSRYILVAAFVFHHPLWDTGKGEGGIDNGEVTHMQLVLQGGGESDERPWVMRNCVKIKPRVEQGITYFLANGHPQVLWQAKV